MISLNHVLTGTAIGLAVKQPALAVPLALASHFVLDAIPHYVYGRPGEKRFLYTWIADALASIAALGLIAWSAPQFALATILAGMAAELPDALWVYYYAAGKPEWWFFRFHKWIQWSETEQGLWYELGYLVILMFINLNLLAGVK